MWHETTTNSSLWSQMMDLIVTHERHFIIFGDMYEVRDESNRYGTISSRLEAHTFSSFTGDTYLVDLPLGGRSYTFKGYGLASLVMQRDGFEEVIKIAYKECSQGDLKQCVTFHEKLKVINKKLKAWNHNVKQGDVSRYHEVKLRLIEIEKKIEKCVASDEERHEKMNLLKECDDLNKLEEMDTFCGTRGLPPLLKPEVSQETTALVAAKWVAKSTTTSLVLTLFYPVTNLIGVEPCGFNGKGVMHAYVFDVKKKKNLKMNY
ncbi:hypothetical protein Tco_0629730 [Tanacetum coccineum]|uniref:Uncharacterized protein n=1 Tax=Tanacetum coccineum TaxID=301880 RepID=A0ABQ4WU29_9ASTR